jgi:CheY-like chemotaxis protein
MSETTPDKFAAAAAKREASVADILRCPSTKRIVVAGPGTGKTFLFKEILKGKNNTLTLTFANALVEDLSLELCGISDVRTLHGFARGIMGKTKGGAKIYTKLPYVVNQDHKILKGSAVDFDYLFHTMTGGTDVLEFYKKRKVYYGHYGFSDVIYAAVEGQLRHAQKMESIGRLTGGIAHDFNNLLTVISGTSELLAETTSDPRLQAMAKRINEAADHGAQLTQRMLAFARKQPLQSRNIDLNEIVNQTATALQRMLGDDISLRCVLTEGVSPAAADPSQVEDALLNLAVNARDAMPRGGQLVIETANVHLNEQYAAQNPEVIPGPYSAITVSDSGSGMPAEVIERAFEPFFTTKEVGRGTGLGLSMIYGFMKQTRGHIKIYSEVGHGTSIKLYFPRGSGLQTSAPVESVESDLLHEGTILVVEDSAAVRSVAREMLESLGYDVIEAEDGASALAVLRAGKSVDLLFTDMIMPKNMTGADLLREARKLIPELRAVLTSGYSEHLIAGLDEADAKVPLLGKPYGKQQLATAVRKALQGAERWKG